MGAPEPKTGSGLNTIAFDGDGVLWAPTWPSPRIGEPNWDAIAAAQEYRDRGFELVIFTARPEDHKVAIYEWLADYGLTDLFYAVICGKPRYALFWDDRAKEWPEALGKPALYDPERPRRMKSGPNVTASLGDHWEGISCAKFGCWPND